MKSARNALIIAASTVLGLATIAAAGLAHSVSYTVQELYPLPGNYRAHAFSLNASGQVVGYSLSPDGDASATLWEAGVARKLDHPVGPDEAGYSASGVARDINDMGQIVGWTGICSPSCGLYGAEDNPYGGHGAEAWVTGSNVPLPPLTVYGCMLDDLAWYISSTGYVLQNGGFVSPWIGEACWAGGTLYESGILKMPEGLLYDPPFSEDVQLGFKTILAGERWWVIVPSCDSATPAFAVDWDGKVSGPPVPDVMKQAICEQFANDYVRDRQRNVHGQYIENVGDRAFLYTPVPDSDGDGVADTLDQCPSSATNATVVLGSCDSGVANFVAANGCTVIDNINACKQGARNAGAIASCAAHYLNALVPTLLSGQEKGRIQSCLRGIR